MMNNKLFSKALLYIFILIGAIFLSDTILSNQTCFAAAVDNIVKPTSIKELTSTKSSIQIIWNKVTSCNGYQIQYASDELFTYLLGGKHITDSSKTTYTVKKLMEKRTYYIRVRTYNIINNKKVYSKWSKVKSVKTKDDKSTNADQEVKARIKAVVSEITSKDMTEPEKLLALYDWMVTYMRYDQSLNDYTVYKAVMNGSGIYLRLLYRIFRNYECIYRQ